MLHFQKKYFLAFVLLFITEVLIARYMHDAFIRPYFGDFLVVILIFCFVKSFLNTPTVPTALGILLFAYTIEMLQYFHIVDRLGLGQHRLARIVIGTSFEWSDMVAYMLGVGLICFWEKFTIYS